MVLENLDVYKIALEISNLAWEIFIELPKEFRFTLGSQFLEAADSIGANIAEGYGRYHYRDSVKFYYNSRGSLLELRFWNTIITQRHLIKSDKLIIINGLIDKEHFKLNSFIASIKSRTLS